MLLSSVKQIDVKRPQNNKQATGLHARSLAKHTVISYERLVQTVQITFKDMQLSPLFAATIYHCDRGRPQIFFQGWAN